jgi:hypothetical protein
MVVRIVLLTTEMNYHMGPCTIVGMIVGAPGDKCRWLGEDWS